MSQHDPHAEKDLFGLTASQASRGAMNDRFLMAPFSVLNSREGDWQSRKTRWLALGIQSEVGRGKALLGGGGSGNTAEQAQSLAERYGRDEAGLADGGIGIYDSATSIFDPVLCELAYRWFCPVRGQIIDPFAGGSVRGIVAAKMQRAYWGCDLREEQIAANREQARDICSEHDILPQWVCGDSRNELAQQADAPFMADFVFSCPPYFDLEIYSELPQDLCNMSWSHFGEAYLDIIEKACRRLKNNRFACFVVGDIRDERGAYRNFPGLTIACFLRAGLVLYNEVILITSVGSLPLRASMAFEATRKLGKTHQNVLVFLKGDAEKAATACKRV